MENLDEKMLTAALNGDLSTVEELVTQGANINYTDICSCMGRQPKSSGFILRFRSKNII